MDFVENRMDEKTATIRGRAILPNDNLDLTLLIRTLEIAREPTLRSDPNSRLCHRNRPSGKV